MRPFYLVLALLILAGTPLFAEEDSVLSGSDNVETLTWQFEDNHQAYRVEVRSAAVGSRHVAVEVWVTKGAPGPEETTRILNEILDGVPTVECHDGTLTIETQTYDETDTLVEAEETFRLDDLF